jgi:RNA recognition motif-containing protein
MAKRLFVGGLPYSVDDAKLNEMFAAIGAVASANVIVDKFTNRSKGFGFVEMTTDEDADKAIKALNNTEVDGRTIVVNEARPREERPQGGFGGGGGGGYRRDNFQRRPERRGGRQSKRW